MKSEEKSINLFKIMSIFIFSFALFIIANSAKAATYGHYTYEYINNNKEIEITKYDGTVAVNIQIPSSINGKPVTSIGDYAFSNCSGLKGNLVIPNGVRSIWNSAFNGCSGLTGNLVIPNSVRSIGERAFNGCSGLTGNLVIPSSVTSIGDYAFYNCKGLTGNLVIRNGVTSIGNSAFDGCSGLKGNLVIPNSVRSIGGGAFWNCEGLTGNIEEILKKLVNDNKITKIPAGIFNGCSGLKGNLVIPNGVTSIGSYAFGWCSGLTGNLVIPNSVTSIGERAFYDCKGLTGNLVIPNSVRSIGERAFSGCSGLTGNLVIPSSVTSIGDYAFYNCKGLTGNLVIPNGVTSIGDDAFSGCSGLKGNLVIPSSVTSIGDYVFSNCSGLTGNIEEILKKLVNDNKITKIPAGIFGSCKNLTGNLVIPNGVTSIGDYAFYDCSGLTGNLVIPKGVTSIGDDAFYDCKGLTGNLVIPKGVTSIGYGAFRYCSGLTGNLVIPSSVTSIGNSAFWGCSGLKGNLVIPNGVTSIGHGAFYGCSGLTGNLIIPNSVTSIGERAFYDCSSLTGNLVIPNGVTSIGAYAFYDCKGLTGNLVIPNGVTSIGHGAFYGCSGLTGNLVIPNSVTSIGKRAFNGCSGLKGNLVIPSSVTSIGDSAFWGCSGLTGNIEEILKKLVNDNKITKIPNRIFLGCSGLTGNLVIPNSVTSIGSYAFENCSGLKGNLVIPNSVTSIGSWAFYGCSGLNSIILNYDAPKLEDWNAIFSIKNIYYNKNAKGYDSSNNYYTSNMIAYNFEDNSKLNKESIGLYRKESSARLGMAYDYDFMKQFVKSISYKVENSKVAMVTQKGVVTPVEKGDTKVIATVTLDDGTTVEKECNVKVTFRITDIELTPISITFNKNESKSIIATILPDYASNKKLAWQSSNEKIATVTQDGVVTPVSSGNCEIVCKAQDGGGTVAKCKIFVDIKATKIELDKKSIVFTKKVAQGIKATVLPENVANKSVEWKSSNEKIATVTQDGVVAPITYGECKIICKAKDGSGIASECAVKVDFKVTEIRLEETEITFNKKESRTLKASIGPAYVIDKSVKWKSSNEKIATVTQKGEITPVSNGTCNITCSSLDGGNVVATCKVNVDFKVTEIKLSNTNLTFTNEKSVRIKSVTVLPSYAKNKNVAWESSNENIAKVDSTGLVTPVKNGKCKIICKAQDGSGIKSECTVKVAVKVTKITLSKSSIVLDRGSKDLTLEAKIEPNCAKESKLKWTSTNENIAKVSSDGKIEIVGSGKCNIVCESTDGSNIKATCKVEVKILKGDYDFSGKVDVRDAFMLLKDIAANLPLGADKKYAGDVNGDGRVNVTDVYELLVILSKNV